MWIECKNDISSVILFDDMSPYPFITFWFGFWNGGSLIIRFVYASSYWQLSWLLSCWVAYIRRMDEFRRVQDWKILEILAFSIQYYNVSRTQSLWQHIYKVGSIKILVSFSGASLVESCMQITHRTELTILQFLMSVFLLVHLPGKWTLGEIIWGQTLRDLGSTLGETFNQIRPKKISSSLYFVLYPYIRAFYFLTCRFSLYTCLHDAFFSLCARMSHTIG